MFWFRFVINTMLLIYLTILERMGLAMIADRL